MTRVVSCQTRPPAGTPLATRGRAGRAVAAGCAVLCLAGSSAAMPGPFDGLHPGYACTLLHPVPAADSRARMHDAVNAAVARQDEAVAALLRAGHLIALPAGTRVLALRDAGDGDAETLVRPLSGSHAGSTWWVSSDAEVRACGKPAASGGEAK